MVVVEWFGGGVDDVALAENPCFVGNWFLCVFGVAGWQALWWVIWWMVW